MSNRRHAASPPDAPPLWRANCCYVVMHSPTLKSHCRPSSSIFLQNGRHHDRRKGPEHLQMTVMKSGLESNRRAPFRPWGNIACPRRQLSPSSWRCRMAMLARVRAPGVKGGPYYCAQGTAIGLLARRRYKPLTLADPPFDPHLASDATR